LARKVKRKGNYLYDPAKTFFQALKGISSVVEKGVAARVSGGEASDPGARLAGTER